MIYSLLHQE